MNRFLAPVLALAALIIVPAAEAAPRVTSAVTLATPTLTLKLAPGSKLKSVKGGTAKQAGRMVTITARGRVLTIVTTGAAPKAWTAAGKPCTVKRAGKKTRLVVTCPAPAAGGQSGGTPGPGGASGNGGQSGAGGTGGTGGNGGNGGGTPGGGNNPGAVAPAAYKYAPYVDFAGWPVPNLALIGSESGAKHISLGFVTKANQGEACTPAWGGFDTYPASGTDPYQLKQVKEFKAAGGDVIPSFGGATGIEFALTCKDEHELAKAYGDVIKAYGVTHVDFDIEGAALKDEDVNVRRNKAIAILQQENPGLVITLTLPALISGMDERGEKLITNAVANGIEIAAVNLMAMNLNVANPAGMGEHAITVGEALFAQLTTLYPSLTEAQVWSKVGLTPMVGVNDDPAQNFTPQDATTLLAWAQGKQIGMLGLWSLKRDELSSVKYQYSKAFVAFD